MLNVHFKHAIIDMVLVLLNKDSDLLKYQFYEIPVWIMVTIIYSSRNGMYDKQSALCGMHCNSMIHVAFMKNI